MNSYGDIDMLNYLHRLDQRSDYYAREKFLYDRNTSSTIYDNDNKS